MRIYETNESIETKEECKTIICNQCGKEIEIQKQELEEGVFTARKEWGYFSRKDGEIHTFDLCENCYDKLVKGFKVPVTISEKVEW